MCWYDATALSRVRAAGGVSDDYRPVPPTAVQTAHRDRCQDGAAAGMDDYVSKPIDPAVLFDVIDHVLTSRMSLPPV